MTRKFWLWAVISHCSTAAYAFLAKPVTQTFGSYGGAALVYLGTSLLMLGAVIFSEEYRAGLRSVWKLLYSRNTRPVILLILALNAFGVISYYVGIQEAQAGDFSVFGRIKESILILFGLLWLRESLSRLRLAAALIAIAGAVFITYSIKALPLNSALLGSAYAACLALTDALVRRLNVRNDGAVSIAGLVALRQWSILPCAIVCLAVSNERAVVLQKISAAGASSWAAMIGLVALLLAIFLGRFGALQKLNAWMMGALLGVQVVVSILLVLFTGGDITAKLVAGNLLAVLAAILLLVSLRTEKSA